ncbi:MAG TPA: SH3 domain-containing protein, partial [Clostridia bacterium]|nr:SH3 domain-containing protein [Clostridia bacterium]
MKKRIACLLLILLALSSAAMPLKDARALSVTTGVIVGDDVALRKTAANNGKLVARLDEGTVVKILETNVFSEWYRIEAGTRTGYVNRMYVNIDPS